MPNPATLIKLEPRQRIYIDRSGPATCAWLAMEAVRAGRQCVLVPPDQEHFPAYQALARLFSPLLSANGPNPSTPLWDWPVISMPSMRLPFERGGWAQSLAALYGLAKGRPCCLVASFQSLLMRFMPRGFFESHVLELRVNTDFLPEMLLEQAVEWGYERLPMVSAPGEIAQRGDILDIYPPGYRQPARIEFFGDTIESIRLFDAESQRSMASLEEISILPASPLALNPEGLAKIEKRVELLEKEQSLNENEAYTIKKCLAEGCGQICPGIAYADSTFIENWLPSDTLWFLPGEADSVEALSATRASLARELEDEGGVQQPARLALRRARQAAPWNASASIFAEPLKMGIEEKGVNLPERDFHQYADLFPLPEDRDRPWQSLARALKTSWNKEYNQVVLAFASERNRKKFLSLAEQDGILPALRYNSETSGLYALISPFRSGADMKWRKVLVLGEDILFPRARKRQRRAASAFRGLDNFEDLKPGMLLVHRDYGIGRFGGLEHLRINDVENDFLLLEYAGNDKLYLPVDRLGMVQKFKGQEGVAPALDRLGSQSWANGKEKARKAIEKIAADLVEMYAYRKVAKSFKYPPVNELYHEFEATFGFEETPDQSRAIQEVLEDMDKSAPMDRLVCGDVGFGKTEVALRAAFRAASEGRQVAILCPTTVLAEQHYQTFRARFAGFPVNVGLLSRFVPRQKQKEVLNACEQGQIDILIGTHRILSNDVKLPNLSLLVLDEEQRFGVRHKEKLKALKKNVDVLTLTATPIPRTLQLSMSGIRDLSVMETAPEERKPVASAMVPRDDATLAKILQRELDRKGQVFWVHNRVHDLENVTAYVRKLAPNARVGMAHGQMGEKELETTMRKFWHGELDVLVSTSIIESGLDFPRANTLVVDNAQMFGLSQLYQLRGRVGRSDRQAYAFFVVPEKRKLTEIAAERLRVILEMDYLGAGFQVAMEDLRMRGAGNILGEVQSGHMSRVGLDLYLEMLEEEVNKLKGMPTRESAETELSLALPANIPAAYIEDGRERLRYYKALSSAEGSAAREEISLAMRDRYGHFPTELRNFLAVLDLKEILGNLQVEKAEIRENMLKLVWRQDQTAVSVDKILKLAAASSGIRLLPPASLQIEMNSDLPLPDKLAQQGKMLQSLAS